MLLCACPQTNRLWEATHLKNIQDVIAELPAIDINRIYILGHSMGGHGIYITIQITPVYFAARQNNNAVVKVLIDGGAAVDAVDENGFTLLLTRFIPIGYQSLLFSVFGI